MIKSKTTEILGIRYPILMGAMAWITKAELVAAVSNGGGAGVIGAGGRSKEWVSEEIRKTKKLTNKPFGINVSLETTPWRDQLIDAIIKEGIDFVTLGAGDPRPFISKFQDADIKVICIVPNTRLAKRVQDAGTDLVVIEGMEAGGRIGTQTTMALLSNVIPEITIPTIAAGGISDGRAIAAALVMGADAVQLGSRFLLATECDMYPTNKEQIIAAQDTDLVTTGLSRGMGMRGLRSSFSDKYLEMEIAGTPLEKLNAFATGCSQKVAEEGIGSDGMNGIVQVGQSVGPLKKIQPAAVIIEELMAETETVLFNAFRRVMEQSKIPALP